MTTIKAYTLSHCESLTSFTIPSTVATLEEGAFYNCGKLSSITIPKSVTSMGNWTFWGCDKLTSVTIEAEDPLTLSPSGNTFPDQSKITLYVPVGCKAAYEAADGWKNFKEIQENVKVGDMFSATTSEGIEMVFKVTSMSPKEVQVGLGYGTACIGTTATGSLTIPAVVNGFSVTSISTCAFKNCSKITVLNVPKGVTTIGQSAFAAMTALSSVTLPSSLTTIYDYAFNGCTALNSVTIPERVTTIGASVFNSCYKLTELTIPSGVTAISDDLFRNCSKLAKVTLTGNVSSIGNNVFNDCGSLTELVANATVPPTAGSYQDNTNTKVSLYVPAGSKAAYAAAVYWKDFKEIIEEGGSEEPTQTDMTDLTGLNNVIYIEPMEEKAGRQVTLSLKMKNTANIRGFQFDLYLPEGVTVTKSGKGKIQGVLNEGRLPDEDEHTLTFSEQPDGAVRFLCSSQYDETFTGNDGEIATLQVSIAEDMEDGDYPILLKAMKLTETDISKFYTADLVQSRLTIVSYVTGDINGDGVVDVSDYTGVANHIHGNTPAGFNTKAADVDENGTIDVSDYTGIANIIHTGSVYGK